MLGLQLVNRFDVASSLEPGEQVSFAELAARCDLPVSDLRRILRHCMSRHIFKEPQMGIVAHTAASRTLAKNEGIRDRIWLGCEQIWSAAAHLGDAIEKWKGSEEPNETVNEYSFVGEEVIEPSDPVPRASISRTVLNCPSLAQ